MAKGLVAMVVVAGVLAGAAPLSAAGEVPWGWQLVAPGVTGDPVAVSPPSLGYADVFIRQGVRVIHYRYREGSGVVTDLGGVATSDPAAAATEEGTYVFVIGADDAIWYRRVASDGTLTPWATLGGIARRNPAAAVDLYGVVHLYAIGTDEGIYTRSLAGGVWSPWQALGGIVTSDPAASPVGVAARGLDGAVWLTSASGWESLGGFIVGEPALGPGAVGAMAPDGRLFIGGNFGWRDTGLVGGAPPTLAAASTGRISWWLNYYGRAPNGRVFVQSWGRGVSEWTDLGGIATSRIAATVVAWGAWCDYKCWGEVVYAVGADGGLYQLAN